MTFIPVTTTSKLVIKYLMELLLSTCKTSQYTRANPLGILVNKSMQKGIFPDSLKLAKVIPIYKGKAKDNLLNYWPLSVACNIQIFLKKSQATV